MNKTYLLDGQLEAGCFKKDYSYGPYDYFDDNENFRIATCLQSCKTDEKKFFNTPCKTLHNIFDSMFFATILV